MFDSEIKILHIESTTVCNAHCPQCSREDSNLYNDATDRSELTVDKCRELFSDKFIKNLDKVFMCGIFGDPSANPNTIDIFKFFRSINPNIILGMNTNGSIQNTSWWKDLASVFDREKDYVVFSIDGLEDTNHIYRIGVNFNKAISNAKAFIGGGGTAHWDMLVFEHNEHQVVAIEEFAKEVGFKWFRTKVSNRFTSKPIKGLRPPSQYIEVESEYNNNIKCVALDEKSVYLTASGEIMPCCWFGNTAFRKDAYTQELLASPNWKQLENSWNNNPHNICKQACSKVNNKTNFTNQWKSEIELENYN